MAALNLDKIKATLDRVPEEFNGLVAQVGLPSGINYEDGTPVAQVAAIQEFGAPAMQSESFRLRRPSYTVFRRPILLRLRPRPLSYGIHCSCNAARIIIFLQLIVFHREYPLHVPPAAEPPDHSLSFCFS